jgi:replication factor A1
MSQLTWGSGRSLLDGAHDSYEDPPTLQVHRIIVLSRGNGPGDTIRYKIVLSDGSSLINSILAIHLNHLVENNVIDDGSIISLLDYMSNTVGGKRHIILLDLDVVYSQVLYTVGEPEVVILR